MAYSHLVKLSRFFQNSPLVSPFNIETQRDQIFYAKKLKVAGVLKVRGKYEWELAVSWLNLILAKSLIIQKDRNEEIIIHIGWEN